MAGFNPGEGETVTVEVPVEFFDTIGPAFLHMDVIDGEVEDPEGHTFSWQHGVGTPGLKLSLSNAAGKAVAAVWINEVALITQLVSLCMKRVTDAQESTA